MRWMSGAAERSIIRGITLGSIAAILVIPVSPLRAQSPPAAPRPNVRLPDEAAGLDAVVRALIGAFDQADIVALGEGHSRQVDPICESLSFVIPISRRRYAPS